MEKHNIEDILAAFPRGQESLIAILQGVQGRFGYLPEDTFQDIAKHIRVSANEAYGVASYYPQFRLNPQGKNSIRVCKGTACHVKGGGGIRRLVQRMLQVAPGETTPDMRFTYETVACFGACALAPVVVFNGTTHGCVTPERARQLIESIGDSTP